VTRNPPRLLCLIGLCFAAEAHDPITTKLTWNRDISRIVYARCSGCHRPGGAAFSLLTYRDARPWAKAIAEEVLERRMPPWGAVKGFGEFRNDQALSPGQLDLIAQWVDGGAPEGDPPSPPASPVPTRPASATNGPRIVVDGEYRTVQPLTIDGLLPVAVPAGAFMRIAAELPDGRIEPLLWLYNYQPAQGHPYLLRKPLRLPKGTVVRGVPSGARVALLLTAAR
jgi:hypothetical protein